MELQNDSTPTSSDNLTESSGSNTSGVNASEGHKQPAGRDANADLPPDVRISDPTNGGERARVVHFIPDSVFSFQGNLLHRRTTDSLQRPRKRAAFRRHCPDQKWRNPIPQTRSRFPWKLKAQARVFRRPSKSKLLIARMPQTMMTSVSPAACANAPIRC